MILVSLAASPPPRAVHAQEAVDIAGGASSAGALDGGQGRIYRETKSRRQQVLNDFLSALPGYLAIFIPVAVFIVFISKRLWRGWLEVSVKPGLEAGIKSKIAGLRAHRTDEKKALASIEAMVRKYADLEGDLSAFNLDELPYVVKAASDLEPITQALDSMSGAARLELAKKLLELHEPQKSAGLLNPAAVKAAALAEGGPEAVLRVQEAAGRLDEFLDQYRTGLPPEVYSAYADALMKTGKHAQALKLLSLLKTRSPADLPRLFELYVRLGNFAQAGELLNEALIVRPLLAEQAAAEGAGGGKKVLPVEKNQEFYYGLALLCEEKGGKELAGRIYRLFSAAGLQYLDVKERSGRLKAPEAKKPGGPEDPPALKAEWWT